MNSAKRSEVEELFRRRRESQRQQGTPGQNPTPENPVEDSEEPDIYVIPPRNPRRPWSLWTKILVYGGISILLGGAWTTNKILDSIEYQSDSAVLSKVYARTVLTELCDNIKRNPSPELEYELSRISEKYRQKINQLKQQVSFAGILKGKEFKGHLKDNIYDGSFGADKKAINRLEKILKSQSTQDETTDVGSTEETDDFVKKYMELAENNYLNSTNHSYLTALQSDLESFLTSNSGYTISGKDQKNIQRIIDRIKNYDQSIQ